MVDAIKELGGHKAPTKPITKPPEKPPAILEHIRYSERRVPSTQPAAPYGLQVIIQTDVTVQHPEIEVDFDGPISNGNFFLAGHAVMMDVSTTISADRKSFTVSFGFPDWTPDAPVVITVTSAQAVSVVAVRMKER